jgi:uncharacterized protein (DUF305 family)
MRMTSWLVRAGAVAGLVALAGCAGGSPPPAAGAPVPATGGDDAAIARARADSARLPYTEADIRFMSAMIGHHAQALEMAAMAPSHGASDAIRTLAGRITNGQRDEIALMQQWLRDRRQPVPDPAHAAHAAHGGHAAMPGMLSPQQIAQLDAARGADFDVLFLRYMIQHHRGAVEMVKELFATYGAGQDETVFRFATDVNVDQATEIDRMERMLAELLFGDAP